MLYCTLLRLLEVDSYPCRESLFQGKGKFQTFGNANRLWTSPTVSSVSSALAKPSLLLPIVPTGNVGRSDADNLTIFFLTSMAASLRDVPFKGTQTEGLE